MIDILEKLAAVNPALIPLLRRIAGLRAAGMAHSDIMSRIGTAAQRALKTELPAAQVAWAEKLGIPNAAALAKIPTTPVASPTPLGTALAGQVRAATQSAAGAGYETALKTYQDTANAERGMRNFVAGIKKRAV